MYTRISIVLPGILFLAAGLTGISAHAGNCRDPWVTKAVTQIQGRSPNGSGDNGECDYRRYGGGKWNSYDDLVAKVRVTFGKSIATPPASSLARSGGALTSTAAPSATLSSAKPAGTGLTTHNGSRVIGEHGAGVVGQNGGSLRR